ncbi:MAG: hypothetical protein WA208_15235 [Thermoanaerobaculia bacterium]
MFEPQTLLVDTNVIIEAVRTGCWRAITGRFVVETVEECTLEAKRGEADRSGYVVVSDNDISRLALIHIVSEEQRAALVLEYPDASGMDPGERDLFAHARSRADETWVILSPDKASVRAAVRLGWPDRIRSLGALIQSTGTRPSQKLKRQFEEAWLVEWRTHFMLDG